MSIIESVEVQKANRRFIKASMAAPMLSREREMALARRWRDGDDVEALHEIISAYARIVIRAASRYRRYGVSMGDLMQEGLVGLMLAAARFDPERETRFSTYATWWVRSAMQDFVLRNWSIVRTGTTASQKSLFFNLRRLRARVAANPDGPLSPEERLSIAEELDVKPAVVEMMEARLSAGDQSLNTPVGEFGEDEWQDLLVDSAPSPEEVVTERHDRAVRSRWIEVALGELSERERTIIDARRLSEESTTLSDLGEVMGISKERVRQLEQRALEKIRLSVVRQTGRTGQTGEAGPRHRAVA